ncbi:hypothetical protein V3C99_014626 [Haemonchus contortus]|uniref:RRM domain-containing protein n=1 Tax=Haemonchus contortus TaxID=6289 RepID=A0A7I4YTH0_HAECO|nr:Maternal tudor protein domain containing protein [Haemonchus contortus]
MDQFPSVSTSIEPEKEFCVKNIPAHFSDWDVFHIFRKYGTVHNVKIPAKQLTSNTKYGFVIMENMNGADEVRYHLKNGKYLCLDGGLQLLVSGVRQENQRSRDEARGPPAGEYSRPPLKELSTRGCGAIVKGRTANRFITQKTQRPPTFVRCFSQDLPLHIPTKVRIVDSPYSCQSVNEGFVFHVIPIDQKLGEEYSGLQREMNKFCLKNPNVAEIPKVGQYVLYYRDAIAYRALCNSELTVYLIDVGETVNTVRSQLWEMIPSFATLPSLVIPCGISGISWKEPTTSMFKTCKNLLKQWSDPSSTILTATVHEYSGLVNMVELELMSENGVEDFADSIVKRGLCTCLTSVQRVYSREDLLLAKNAKACGNVPPISLNENIAEIVVGLQTITVA